MDVNVGHHKHIHYISGVVVKEASWTVQPGKPEDYGDPEVVTGLQPEPF